MTPKKDGYSLIFQDEFDSPALDTDKWLPLYFPHGTVCPENCRPTYTIKDSVLNLVIDETTPHYAADSDMKVSSIQTIEKNLLHPGAGTVNLSDVAPYESFATQYGYFEMRAKLPVCGGGGHMAWWLIGAQDDAAPDGSGSKQTGEIDIVETLYSQNHIYGPSVHPWTDPNLHDFHRDIHLTDFDDTAFHIYALDWTPDGLRFLVDGECLASTPQSPAYRMGMFLGLYTNCDWSGADNGVYPKCLSVDYIRVYKRNAE